MDDLYFGYRENIRKILKTVKNHSKYSETTHTIINDLIEKA